MRQQGLPRPRTGQLQRHDVVHVEQVAQVEILLSGPDGDLDLRVQQSDGPSSTDACDPTEHQISPPIRASQPSSGIISNQVWQEATEDAFCHDPSGEAHAGLQQSPRLDAGNELVDHDEGLRRIAKAQHGSVPIEQTRDLAAGRLDEALLRRSPGQRAVDPGSREGVILHRVQDPRRDVRGPAEPHRSTVRIPLPPVVHRAHAAGASVDLRPCG